MTERGTCLICQSVDLNYGRLEIGAMDSIWYPYSCNDCGATGREFYSLTYDVTESATPAADIIDEEQRAAVIIDEEHDWREARCTDCGERYEIKGHQDCQYPSN